MKEPAVFDRSVRELTRLIAQAQRCAANARRAPDPIAQFYDLARLDGTLQSLRCLVDTLADLVQQPN